MSIRNAVLGFTFGVAATAAFGLAGRDDAIETAFAAGYAKAQAQYRIIVQDTHTEYQALPQRCLEALYDNEVEVDTYEYP